MVSAFSVPKAKREQKVPHNPGPGQYNPENSPKVVQASDPQYSFGKDGRKESRSKVPGPGSYEEKGSFIKETSPRYTFQPRRDDSPNRLNVGPGQYDPNQRYSKNNSPSYSIYGRSNSELKGINVGPGQYDIKSSLDLRKSHKFANEPRELIDKRTVPGPGTYDYENAVFKYGSKQDPSYGFRSKLSDPKGLEVPGPGSYENKSALYSKIGGIVSREMRNSYADSKTPGPGNYDPDSSRVKGQDPQWSISKSPRDQMSKSSIIGPGAYDHDKNYKSLVTTNKGYGFGNDNKLKYDINNVPGPGSYEGNGIKQNKGIKMAGRIKDLDGLNVPGPGTYENEKYDYKSWLQGGGKYSVGKGPRDSNEAGNVPGPGAYYSKQLGSSKKITFGRDSRLKHEKSLNPGPGHYQLKPFFADVPHYLLPNKNQ